MSYRTFRCFVGSMVASDAVTLSARSNSRRTFSWSATRGLILAWSAANSLNEYMAKLYKTSCTSLTGVTVFLPVPVCCGDGSIPGFGRGNNSHSFNTCPDRSGQAFNE